jgi:hypothetical protein
MIPDELERYFQQRAERDAFSGVVLVTREVCSCSQVPMATPVAPRKYRTN